MSNNKPFKYYGIPTELLLQMGHYDTNIAGVKFKTHVIDCPAAADKHIAELRSRLELGPKIVGIDHKKLKTALYSENVILVLCALGQCLIIHLERVNPPGAALESLDNFLDDPKICFVGITLPRDIIYYVKYKHNNTAAKVSELAARVLKKPELAALTLSDIAKEVGVKYDSPASGATEFQVDPEKVIVFTEENIVAAISDAFAYYQIGFKLLTSLSLFFQH